MASCSPACKPCPACFHQDASCPCCHPPAALPTAAAPGPAIPLGQLLLGHTEGVTQVCCARQEYTRMLMNIWKKYLIHCNFDCSSQAVIIAHLRPASSVCALGCRRAVHQRDEATTATRLHALAWWLVCSEFWFPPETFVTGATGGRGFWKSSHAEVVMWQTQSNELSLWTFRKIILKTCSKLDWWDILCSALEKQDMKLETIEHFLLYLLLLLGNLSTKRQQFPARWLRSELERIRVSLYLGILWIVAVQYCL